MIDDILREAQDELRRDRPRREALKTFDRLTARLVVRDTMTSGTPTYRLVRLADLRWIPAHDETLHEFGTGKTHKRRRPDVVRLIGTGHIHDIPPARLDEAVRRPTARALARIEAAEAAIAAATEELKAARRAAFTYGRPVPVSTVKKTTSERRRIEEQDR